MTGLYIPYDRTALNRRPAAAATYASGGIFLSGPPGSTEGEYLFDKEHQINVVVKNDSGQALDGITVQTWVCQPTSNAGPSTVIKVQTGLDPSGAPILKPLFFTASIARLERDGVAAVSHRWKPGQTELNVAGGHVCLASNVCADGTLGVDGVEFPPLPDPKLPTLTMLHPETDDHHAQRNVNRVKVTAGPAPVPAGGMANPGAEDGIFLISLVEQVRLREFDSIDLLHLLSDPLFAFVDSDRLVHEVPTKPLAKVPEGLGEAVTIRLNRAVMLAQGFLPALVLRDERGWPLDVRHPILLPATQQAGSPVLGLDGERAGAATVEIQAGASLPVQPGFEIPPDDEIGSVHVFDLTQSDRSGNVLGGMRILAVNVPPELAEPKR